MVKDDYDELTIEFKELPIYSIQRVLRRFLLEP